MAASSLDPEVAFGPQQEWESPRQERPWLGLSLEALQLWGMPEEAWPGYGIPWDNLWNYTLKKKDHPNIHVHLARQVFTTKPAHEKHTYFSFWMSEEFEVGPVAKPLWDWHLCQYEQGVQPLQCHASIWRNQIASWLG